jgi:hypothetical protein
MQLVSAVYPNADVDLSGRKVVLNPSPAPLERKLVGTHLRLLGAATGEKAPRSSVVVESGQAAKPATAAKPAEELLAFPLGSLSFGTREAAFRSIGVDKGHPWSVDQMADAFRAGFPGIARQRSEKEWLRVWEAFVVSYARRRDNSDAE